MFLSLPKVKKEKAKFTIKGEENKGKIKSQTLF